MKYTIDKEDSVEVEGHKLFRIVATEAFGGVKPGDKGGFIEDYYNLSRDDSAWIHKDSYVFESARVSGAGDVINSTLRGKALLLDNATVTNSHISDTATISGKSVVSNSRVTDSAIIKDSAYIDTNSAIGGNAIITGAARVRNSTVAGNATVGGSAGLYMSAVMGNALVRDECYIEGARLYSGQYFGRTLVKRNVIIRVPVIIQNGTIRTDNDLFVFSGGFTNGNLITVYRSDSGRLAYVIDGEFSTSKHKLASYLTKVDEGFLKFIEDVTNASFTI